jgi:hypothetical protein
VIITVVANDVIIACAVSALPRQADITSAAGYVRKVPIRDIDLTTSQLNYQE